MAAGRPTKYDPKYCEMLINQMSKGYTFEAFAGYIGVSRSTLYKWVEENSEFSDSKELAFEKSRYFWETVLLDTIYNHPKEKTANSTLIMFNLRNRLNWRMSDRPDEAETVRDDFLLPPSLVIDVEVESA